MGKWTKPSAAEDRPAPLFIGGALSLDFVNTQPILEGQMVEMLPSDRAFFHWAKRAEFAVPRRVLRAADREALDERVVLLRRAMRQMLRRLTEGRETDARALKVVNRWAARPLLHWTSKGYRQQEKRIDSVEAMLEALATDFADLLTGPAAQIDGETGRPVRLRGCDATRCVLYFVDSSRGGRRRWCDMAICGNREKVAAHRARSHRS